MPVSDADKTWLQADVFTWMGPFAVGDEFASQLYAAVLFAAEDGDLPAAELLFTAANDKHHYIPARYNFFLADKLGIARRMIDQRDLGQPGVEFQTHWNEEFPGDLITTARPVPVSLAAADAYGQLLAEVSQQTPEAYVASRGPEIAAAKGALDAGTLRTDEAPELALQALQAREELRQASAAADAELKALEGELTTAKARRDDLAAQVAAAEAVNAQERKAKGLEGFSKAWKKVSKQVSRSWSDTVGLTEEVRRIGSRIDQEQKRFGRRIDKELQRNVEKVATFAPWIYALAPIIGFIPVIGWILAPIIIAIVASCEVTYAAKQKDDLDHALRKARHALQAQIAELLAEAADLERRAAELEEERKRLSALIVQEQAARLALTIDVEGGRANKRRNLILAASGIVIAARVTARVSPKSRTAAKVAAAAGLAYLVFQSFRGSGS